MGTLMNSLPFPTGRESTITTYRGLAGKEFYDPDTDAIIMLVRATTAAAITGAASKVIDATLTGQSLSKSKCVASSVAAASNYKAVGIADPNLSGDLTAGAMFYVWRSGEVNVRAESTNVATGVLLCTQTTQEGNVDRALANSATAATNAVVYAAINSFGVALETATASDDLVKARLFFRPV